MNRNLVFVYVLIALASILESIPYVFSLSLNELHSTSRFNRYRDDDKSLRSALDSIRGKRRQFHSINGDNTISLPLRLKTDTDHTLSRNLAKRFPIKRQEEEVMDIPLEYGEENPFLYDYVDMNSLRIPSGKEYGKNRLFSQSLARKISHLFDNNKNKIKFEKRSVKKRILVKRNNPNKDKEIIAANTPMVKTIVKKERGGAGAGNSTRKALNAKDAKSKHLPNGGGPSKVAKVLRVESKAKQNKSNLPKTVNKQQQQQPLKSKNLRSEKRNQTVTNAKKPMSKATIEKKTIPTVKLNDKKVMDKLKVIMDKNERSVNKRRTVKRTVDESEMDDEINEQQKENDFQQWLRDEYWRNMAQSLAIRKKKRSVDYTDYFDSDEDADNELVANDVGEKMNENLVLIGKDDNDNDTKQTDFDKNDKADEDYATSLTPLEMNDESENNVENNERKRKMKRSVESYFGDIDEDVVAEEEEKFNDVDVKLEKIQNDLINEALQIIRENSEKVSQTPSIRERIGHRLDAAYDLEDMRHALSDLHKTMRKIEDEHDVEDRETDTSISVFPLRKMEKKIGNDCSAIEDVVPRGKMQKAFIDTCNWHEVCYSCGQFYGLSVGDCDAGFLEKSRAVCNDSSSCESAARLILMPLRQRRVFYKRKIPIA
ncbi:uncharacterized protein B4U79_13506, partial [Dinothrombium tinctorium]